MLDFWGRHFSVVLRTAEKTRKKTGPPKSKVYDVVFVGKIDAGGSLKIFGFLDMGWSHA